MQLVTASFIFIVPRGAPHPVQVVFKGGWAGVTHHRMPLWHDTCIFDALEMRGGAVVMGVINAEAPPTILPQGTIPFGVVGFLVAALETVGEWGVLAFPFHLILGYSPSLKTILSFDIAPLVLQRSLRSEDSGNER